MEKMKAFVNDIVNRIKHTYEYIRKNYNYKQALLIFLVFFTIWSIEKINYLNAMQLALVANHGLVVKNSPPLVIKSSSIKSKPKTTRKK